MGEKKSRQSAGDEGGVFESTMRTLGHLSVDERQRILRIADEAMDRARNENREPLGWLKAMFSVHLVYGVWLDESYPGGIAVALLKGWENIERIMANGMTEILTETSVRCGRAAQAEVYCQQFGDGQGLTPRRKQAPAR
jgi:hypothetical protein